MTKVFTEVDERFTITLSEGAGGTTAIARLRTTGQEIARKTYGGSSGALSQCALAAFEALGDKVGRERYLDGLASMLDEIDPDWRGVVEEPN